MSYKLQPFAMSSVHDVLPLHDCRSALPANWEDARFFRSWLVYDSKIRRALNCRASTGTKCWDSR